MNGEKLRGGNEKGLSFDRPSVFWRARQANGYRPSTSEPGHQQTTIQTLPKPRRDDG
jgi:hypothetical protein